MLWYLRKLIFLNGGDMRWGHSLTTTLMQVYGSKVQGPPRQKKIL